jgi:hypothetical protein
MDIQKRWGFNYEFGIETAKRRAAETAIGVIWRNSPEKNLHPTFHPFLPRVFYATASMRTCLEESGFTPSVLVGRTRGAHLGRNETFFDIFCAGSNRGNCVYMIGIAY